MKIRNKMMISMLALTLVPIISITFFATARYRNYATDQAYYDLEANQSTRASNIGSFLQDIVASEKDTSSLPVIREYAELTDSLPVEEWDSIECAEAARLEVSRSSRTTPYVIDAYLINNDGIITASSNEKLVGQKNGNAAEISAGVTKASGIGYIYSDSNRRVCTTISRRVYSSTNKKVGIYYQVINLSQLVNYLNTPAVQRYESVFLMDTEGNVVDTGSRAVSPFQDTEMYSAVTAEISPISVAVGPGNEKNVKTVHKDKRLDISVYGDKILTGEWCVVTVADNDLIRATVSDNTDAIRNLGIILAIPAAILAVLLSIWFTAPIREIVSVIEKKNNGDSKAKLSIDTNDEFGEISFNFNTMFDSIYESEQRYRTIVSMTDNIIFEINLLANKMFVSDNFHQKFDFRAADDTVNSSFLFKMKVFKDDSARFNADVNSIFGSSDQWEAEYRLKNRYGDFIWTKIIAKKFYDHSKNPTRIIGFIVDIDKAKRSEINLIEKASYDALTRLYNRETFMRLLDAEIEKSVQRKSLDALLFVDLDDFKHFNDEYGHACGDEVLKFVADSIKEITYDKGFGGRVGGDEFVFALSQLTLIGDAGKAAGELIDMLAAGFESESTGLHLNIHCSIGIAFFRENGNTSVEIKEAADTAMYNIKKHGKSNFAYAQQSVNPNSDKLDKDILDGPINNYDPDEETDPQKIKLSDMRK